MKQEVVVERTGTGFGSRLTRASWGAIFAGMFVTIVLQIMFTLLGAAIGFASINPMDQQNPGQGLALGSLIWIVITSLISLWVGSCVAGRLSGGPLRSDGMIHGIVTWSFATIVTLFLLATATGALLGGAGSLLGNVLNSNNGQSSQNVAEGLKGLFPQASNLLPPTGRTQNTQTPGKLTSFAQQDPELAGALARLESSGGGNAQDRDQVVNILVTKHKVSQQEASNLVNQWDQQVQQVKGQVNQQAREVGQQAAQGISQGALWAFIALILGLLVSAWGGWVGASSVPVVREVTTPVVT